ncbi:MFS transporter [Bdellovibrio sp. HCB-162]|uniref:MFS transporter n=1 Tax=Bdellovibrio sp. HCB-162 TaxID=3394234 RepID=UPI0039BC6A7F
MKKQFNQHIVIGSLSASVLLASLGTSMANIVLPAISLDFGVSFSEAKWVVLSYLIVTTAFSLIVGRIGDLKGRRTTLVLGTIFFVIGALMSASSSSFALLIFARIVQGIGGASLIVLPIAIVTNVISKEKTGRIIGLLATTSAIGTATGPSLGGFLLGVQGWRIPFFLVAALGFLNLLLVLFFVPSDVISAAERQKSSALIDMLTSIYGDASLRTHLLSNSAVSAVMMSTLIGGPFYLTRVLKVAPVEMGLVMSAGPITSILFGVFSGVLVDRFGLPSILKFAFIQLLIGASAFVFLPSLLGAVGFAFSAVCLSFGYQMFLSANSSCIMKNVEEDRRGLISGALSLSRNLGLMGGTLIMGSIFEVFGLQIVFLVAAILIALMFFVHLKIQKRRIYETRFTR